MPRVRIIDNQPQINVKDHTAYWGIEPYRSLLAELGSDAEHIFEQVYEDARADFWQDVAPEISEQHGYSREVYSEGRSGGWLVPTGSCLHFLGTLNADDPWSQQAPDLDALRERGVCSACGARTYRGEECVCEGDSDAEDVAEEFEMAQDIVSAIAQRDNFMRFAEAIELAVDGAREILIEHLREEVAELNDRREACIVLGEN